MRRLAIHVGLFLVTALTTTTAGALLDGADPFASPAALARGIPFSAALLAILLCHEMGHYLMCLRYGIDASPPYFLPAPPLGIIPIGTFGAFIRVRGRFRTGARSSTWARRVRGRVSWSRSGCC
jgi:membrane-associated protease RseP (regulator of RpoE activity)